MEAYICVTCGVQHGPTKEPPPRCPICEDERQYVRHGGQAWTTLAGMRAKGHRIEIRDLEPGLAGIGVQPDFAIGQHALLVQTPKGNILWDCIGFIDDEAIQAVQDRGGIAGIALSHPHFYGAMVDWSLAFQGAPIHVPEDDLEWVQRPYNVVRPWSRSLELLPGLTLIKCGGHFDGSAVLHWAAGAEGRGALLVGDTMAVAPDIRYVSFMRSYPNHIPLPASQVRRIVDSVRPYPFDRIYGGWWDRVIPSAAMSAVERSVRRYLKWIGAEAEP
jgi:hypothetical protein